MPSHLSRRELVERCLSAGALFLAPALPLAVAMPLLADEEARPVTPHADLGPFYKRKAPRTAALAPEDAAGVPLTVDGVVLDTRGELLPGAVLELWHASSAGPLRQRGLPLPGRRRGGPEGRLRVPDGPARTLRRARLPAHPLHGDGARPQAARHAALLRDRPRVRRRPGQELPEGPAHHEPRARAARVPLARTARRCARASASRSAWSAPDGPPARPRLPARRTSERRRERAARRFPRGLVPGRDAARLRAGRRRAPRRGRPARRGSPRLAFSGDGLRLVGGGARRAHLRRRTSKTGREVGSFAAHAAQDPGARGLARRERRGDGGRLRGPRIPSGGWRTPLRARLDLRGGCATSPWRRPATASPWRSPTSTCASWTRRPGA